MLVSYNWLKQYTNVEDNATDLAEKITRGGSVDRKSVV